MRDSFIGGGRGLWIYVDLDTMPNSPGSSATFTQTMQALESFIRTTLLQNIPVIGMEHANELLECEFNVRRAAKQGETAV